MKIAVVSDTHDNLPNFKKALGWIENNNIKIIIHCGDICTLPFLRESINDFPGKIYLCLGNVDKDHFEISSNQKRKFNNVLFFNEWGELELDNKKIAFTHFPDLAKKLAITNKYDIIFYGHTHKPWEEKTKKTKIVNPGNLAGLFYKPTFAIYDTKKDNLQLKILEKIKNINF
jgi:uncharacterized protein